MACCWPGIPAAHVTAKTTGADRKHEIRQDRLRIVGVLVAWVNGFVESFIKEKVVRVWAAMVGCRHLCEGFGTAAASRLRADSR
jgi:hypothetical protein